MNIETLFSWEKVLLAHYLEMEFRNERLKEYLSEPSSKKLLKDGEWERLFQQMEVGEQYSRILKDRLSVNGVI